jgi:acyl-coenzyme A thioesterase PaaI-like protein
VERIASPGNISNNYPEYHFMDMPSIMEILQSRLGDRIDEFILPPPVFDFMQAELVEFDPDSAYLKVSFPIMEEYLNPYGVMQGGLVAAAADNTLGPLSMLVAPPNVTRSLEMKFSQPVYPQMEKITVEAWLKERDDPWLRFTAQVRDQDSSLLARARAVHWIVDFDVDQG